MMITDILMGAGNNFFPMVGKDFDGDFGLEAMTRA